LFVFATFDKLKQIQQNSTFIVVHYLTFTLLSLTATIRYIKVYLMVQKPWIKLTFRKIVSL